MACRILTRMVLHFCRVGRAGKGSRRPKIWRRSWQKWKNSRNIKRLAYNRIPQKCAKSSLEAVRKLNVLQINVLASEEAARQDGDDGDPDVGDKEIGVAVEHSIEPAIA